MVDVAVTNKKLRDRALRILQDLTGLRPAAASILEQSGNSVKLALQCIGRFEPRGRRSPFGRT